LYLDVLEEFLIPVLEENCPDALLFQQDGVPLHFHKEGWTF
jgi:hypothetical protein